MFHYEAPLPRQLFEYVEEIILIEDWPNCFSSILHSATNWGRRSIQSFYLFCNRSFHSITAINTAARGGGCNLTEHHNTKIHFHLMPSPNWGAPFKSGKIRPQRTCFTAQFKGEARLALCKYMFLWPVRNAECTQHNGFLSLTCKASMFFFIIESRVLFITVRTACKHHATPKWTCSMPTAIRKIDIYTYCKGTAFISLCNLWSLIKMERNTLISQRE